jgi:hypothetical protein
MAELAGQFFKRFVYILEQESISYDQKEAADLIMKHAPDWRRVLNEAQRYSNTNSYLSIPNSNNNSGNFGDLTKTLKDKNFKAMRRWVVDNMDMDTTAIFRGLYDSMYTYVDSHSIPQLVLLLADYQYKDAFVADHELNMVACLTEVMRDIQFK